MKNLFIQKINISGLIHLNNFNTKHFLYLFILKYVYMQHALYIFNTATIKDNTYTFIHFVQHYIYIVVLYVTHGQSPYGVCVEKYTAKSTILKSQEHVLLVCFLYYCVYANIYIYICIVVVLYSYNENENPKSIHPSNSSFP